MLMPNTELIAHCFPNTPYTPTKGPNDTLLSIAKAKRELGFEPKYDWDFAAGRKKEGRFNYSQGGM
jgi:nucleoside-diphosphate-sugar epimerase